MKLFTYYGYDERGYSLGYGHFGSYKDAKEHFGENADINYLNDDGNEVSCTTYKVIDHRLQFYLGILFGRITKYDYMNYHGKVSEDYVFSSWEKTRNLAEKYIYDLLQRVKL